MLICSILFCQLLTCLSSILSKIPSQSQHWMLFVTVSFYFGLWGSRCWTAMVAFSLYLVRCKGDEAVKKLRVLIWVFGFGWVSQDVCTKHALNLPSARRCLVGGKFFCACLQWGLCRFSVNCCCVRWENKNFKWKWRKKKGKRKIRPSSGLFQQLALHWNGNFEELKLKNQVSTQICNRHAWE